MPGLLLPLALDAQFGTPYPRSTGFDTDSYVMDEETTRDIVAFNDRSDLKKLLAKLKQKSLKY